MIHIKEFIRGFLGLNLYLTPFHFYFIFAQLHPISIRLGAVMDYKIEAFYFFTFLTFFKIFGPQILILLSLFIFTKLWDLIFLKSKFYTETVSLKGIVFGAFISSILAMVYGNIYIDNLYQFKGSNYFAIFIPFWATLFYYLICYVIGSLRGKFKNT